MQVNILPKDISAMSGFEPLTFASPVKRPKPLGHDTPTIFPYSILVFFLLSPFFYVIVLSLSLYVILMLFFVSFFYHLLLQCYSLFLSFYYFLFLPFLILFSVFIIVLSSLSLFHYFPTKTHSLPVEDRFLALFIFTPHARSVWAI